MPTFRRSWVQKKIRTSAGTIEELVEKLSRDYDRLRKKLHSDEKSGELNARVNVTLNGRIAETLKGPATELEDGDVVAIFPLVPGG